MIEVLVLGLIVYGHEESSCDYNIFPLFFKILITCLFSLQSFSLESLGTNLLV